MLAVSDEFLYADDGGHGGDVIPIPWGDIVAVETGYIGKGVSYTVEIDYIQWEKGYISSLGREAGHDTVRELRRQMRRKRFRNFQATGIKFTRRYFRPGKYRTSGGELYYYVAENDAYWYVCCLGGLTIMDLRQVLNAPEDPNAAMIIS